MYAIIMRAGGSKYVIQLILLLSSPAQPLPSQKVHKVKLNELETVLGGLKEFRRMLFSSKPQEQSIHLSSGVISPSNMVYTFFGM